MRERRTTVRINCFLPAQYRPFETAPEFPGLVTDVSVEGLRLLSDHQLDEGQHVRVGFALPDHGRAEQELDVQGIVRWRAPQGAHGFPTGLEFEQLDETSRFRLQSFITQRTEPAKPAGRKAAWVRKGSWMSALSIAWPLLLGLLCAAGCLWILSLRREQERLQQQLVERTAVMQQLQSQQAQIQDELDHTRVAASLMGVEARQLEGQRAEFGQEIARLGANVTALNQEVTKLQAERDALKQWVQALEQQQKVLEQKLASIPELRKALREAYDRQSQQQRAQLLQWWASHFKPASGLADTLMEGGNRGYLVRNGHSTGSSKSSGSVPLSIRVLSPESSQ